MLRRILFWSTLLVLLPLAGRASAQVVTLEWSAQTDALAVAATLADTQVVKLNYGVSGAALRNVNLVIDLPPDVAPSQITKPLSFAGGCTVVQAGSSAPTWGSFRYRCTYATGAIDPAAGSVTGDITFNVLLRRQNFEHLQPLLFTATITGLNAADQPVQIPSERTFDAAGVPTLSSGAATILTGWAAGDYDPDGPSGPIAPMQGLYEAAAFNIIGLGTTSIAPGTLGRFTLRASDYLVTYLVDPTLTAAGPEHFTAQVGTPGGVFAATANNRLFGGWNTVPANGNVPNWNNQVNGTSTGYFRALIFYPCDSFVGTPLRTKESNVRLDGFGQVWGADDLALTRTLNNAFPATISGRRCGQAQITKSAPATTGIGRNYSWTLSALSPLGVPISDDAYIVDALPPDNRLRSLQRNSLLGATSTEFDVRVCRLPDLAGQLIPREVFLAEVDAWRTAGHCHTTPAASFSLIDVTALGLEDATHIVATATTWGLDPRNPNNAFPDGPDPRTTAYPFSIIITCTPTAAAALTPKITNDARLAVDALTLDATRDINMVTTANVQGHISTLSGVVITNEFAPGSPITVRAGLGSNAGPALVNTRIRVTYPASITITSVDDTANHLDTQCGAEAATVGPLMTHPGPDGDVQATADNYQYVDVDMHPGATTDFYQGCGSNDIVRAILAHGTVKPQPYPHDLDNPLSIKLEAYLDNVAATATAPGLVAPATPTAAFVFTQTLPVPVRAAGELRLVIEPTCPTLAYGADPDLDLFPAHWSAADHQRMDALVAEHGAKLPLHYVRATNTGGTTLQAVVMNVVVPRVGVPAGNTASSNTFDSELVEVFAPGNGTVAYCTGPVGPAAACSAVRPESLAAITSIRVSVPALGAYQVETVAVALTWSGLVAQDTPLVVAGDIAAQALSQVANADYAPWRVGSCANRVTLRKFFDVSRDGDRDDDEPYLAGWEFEARRGEVVQRGVTDAAGRVDFVVPAGQWEVSEVFPIGTEGTWFPTVSDTVVVDVGEGPVSERLVGNDCFCDDGNDCTLDVCAADGTCSHPVDPNAAIVPTTCGRGACAAEGESRCVGTTRVDTCSEGPAAPSDVSCNDSDDNCDGETDEGYVSQPVVCADCFRAEGTRCEGGQVITPPCLAWTGDDGLGAVTTCGEGECAATGKLVCVAGARVDTCDAPDPTVAHDVICDGKDEDCDGATDESYTPEQVPCATCWSAAATRCEDGAIVTPACAPQTDPVGSGTPTNCGVGACAATGEERCDAGVLVDSCAAGNPAASDATCNGVDEDCSGQADEDFVPQAVACGDCHQAGSTSCVAGAVVTPPCLPWTGDDGLGAATSCGQGACAAVGKRVCQAGARVDTCTPGIAPAASDLLCDGADGDCDGQTDEDFVPVQVPCTGCHHAGATSCASGVVVTPTCQPLTDPAGVATSCGVGACAGQGQLKCTGGALVDSCIEGTPAPSDTTCDAIDDDCDGQTDEDYVRLPPPCSDCFDGASSACPPCHGLVRSSCEAGVETAQRCVPLADGTACDGGACALDAACQAGACVVTTPVVCTAGACTTSTCDPSTGCVEAPVEDGTPCDDDDLCTTADQCVAGRCEGDLIVCDAAPACHDAGQCDAATGVCTYSFIDDCVDCAADVAAPVVTCPPPLEFECAGAMTVVEVGSAVGIDVCSAVATHSDWPAEGFAPGETVVTMSAEDEAGNVATCETTVVVVDTTAPVLTCPDRVTLTGDFATCDAATTLPVSAQDACDGALAITAERRFGPGTTRTSVSVGDAAGNVATCDIEVVVTLADTIDLACGDVLDRTAPPDACGISEVVHALVDGTCATIAPSGDAFPVGTTEVVVGEGCVTRVVVADDTAPVVRCGAPPADPSALPWTATPSAEDACGVTLEWQALGCLDARGDVMTEGCTLERRGDVLTATALPTAAGPVTVRYALRAVDPSGNATTLTCEVDVPATTIADRDDDGVPDAIDNCPDVPNPDQLASDLTGDACRMPEPVPSFLVRGGPCQGAPGGQGLALCLVLVWLVRRRYA